MESKSQPVTTCRYRMIRPLAEGAFGQVYLGQREGVAGFRRSVAIKRILPQYTSSQDFVEDFIREARIGGYLQHQNVVQVLDFEQIDGDYALVMEYVDGVGLDQVLELARDGGIGLPLSVVAEICAQAADGLEYVHALKDEEGSALQLVHRDLKPSNLLISRTGMVKLTDFGIARTALELGRATRAGFIKGTLAYLSPEQARGEKVNHRSDLYSLGSILYELITFEPLFRDSSTFGLLTRLAQNQVEEKLEGLTGQPGAVFLPLLRGLLTLRPDERIASASEVATRLRALQATLDMPGVDLRRQAERWIELTGKGRSVRVAASPSSARTMVSQPASSPTRKVTRLIEAALTVKAPGGRPVEPTVGGGQGGMVAPGPYSFALVGIHRSPRDAMMRLVLLAVGTLLFLWFIGLMVGRAG